MNCTLLNVSILLNLTIALIGPSIGTCAVAKNSPTATSRHVYTNLYHRLSLLLSMEQYTSLTTYSLSFILIKPFWKTYLHLSFYSKNNVPTFFLKIKNNSNISKVLFLLWPFISSFDTTLWLVI